MTVIRAALQGVHVLQRRLRFECGYQVAQHRGIDVDRLAYAFRVVITRRIKHVRHRRQIHEFAPAVFKIGEINGDPAHVGRRRRTARERDHVPVAGDNELFRNAVPDQSGCTGDKRGIMFHPIKTPRFL